MKTSNLVAAHRPATANRGTSHQVLSDQLRELADAGIISRKSFNTMPSHLEYQLTAEGENFHAALRYLHHWKREIVN